MLGPVDIHDSHSGLIVIPSFGWNDSCGRTPSGRRWNRIVWVSQRILGEAATTIACSSKRFFGSCGLAVRGVICLPSSESGTAFSRDYRGWVKADVFIRLFEACSGQPDMEYAMVDATIVKVHRHGQGAKGGLKARP